MVSRTIIRYHELNQAQAQIAVGNIIIRNCRMKDGRGDVTIGSEASGGVRNVLVENCRMDSPKLKRVLRFKTSSEINNLRQFWNMPGTGVL
jgi:polygalacturonase